MSEADERARLVQAALESISAGSKSFRFASQLFDQQTRERSWLLYSWCRACDDVTDGQTLGHDAERVDDPAARLAFLKAKTAEAFAGQPTGLVPFDALRVVAAECAIPQAVAGDHLAGFERDAGGWRPTTTDDLLSYCYQVAGAVGVMMAHVMGVPPEDEDTLNRAADLGIAFQLANIARDIVDDAKVGRVYLPAEWLAAEGLAGADLADPAHRPALARLAHRLADMADAYRRSARVGAARLPFRSRWAVLAASGIYGEIATRAAALGPRAWDERITTSKAEKAALVMEAFWEALWRVRPAPRDGLWTRPAHA
ncbi:phytoene/squalene synthase family protein [Sphingomonas astaxanthinifaciens]|uniref:Phytoene synthase n=1 Tax=Sphingomonas astaxanthinifaciens DSM 22298 TaxID=1123267 RepID=A0ABQ5Z6X0_9SPHN|nr:phytoene/squalene synthase family protein [Sphingomonas astaxanthinifaciens]GLR48520.1 phytoene synthase [Sphingomonas astaxanthinifaciens DSM 22298]